MNCDFTLEKSNLPDTKVILINYIEEKYCLKLNYQTDKIYMYDIKGQKFLVSMNNFEDLKDLIPDPVRILVVKEKCKDSKINKHQIENMLNELDNFGFNNVGDTGESMYIKPDDKKDKINKEKQIESSINSNFEVEAFTKILGYLQTSAYTASQDFDIAMSKKPYGELYYNTLKAIQQSKNYIVDITEKFKKLETYAANIEKTKLNLEFTLKTKENESNIYNSRNVEDIKTLKEEKNKVEACYNDLKKNFYELTNELEKVKKEKLKLNKEMMNNLSSNSNSDKDNILREVNHNLQKKCDELMQSKRNQEYSIKNLIQKYQNTFIADIHNEVYLPNEVSKDIEFIGDFYNNLIFQAKNKFVVDLKALNDFFDYNSGMIRMIVKSKGYSKVKDLINVELTKLESKDIKIRCEVFSVFLQNIYNLID